MKISKWCICGANWRGTVSDKFGKFLLEEWAKEHSVEGHKQCNSKTAYKTRSTEYKEVIK